MNNLLSKLLELFRYLKGSLYFRFSVILCYIGASFIYPQLWEVIVYYAVEIYKSLINPNVKSYEFGTDPASTTDIVIGCAIILIGIGLFIFFQLKEKKNVIDISAILNSWQNIHDISDDPNSFNVNDVIKAINVINESSNVLLNAAKKYLEEFNESRGDDFIQLYEKIVRNKYLYDGKVLSDQLNQNSHLFYKKLLKL